MCRRRIIVNGLKLLVSDALAFDLRRLWSVLRLINSNLLIVLGRCEHLIFNSIVGLALVLAHLFPIQLLVDDMLFKGGVMQTRASKFEVVELKLAVHAWQDLELVGDVPNFITQKTI